MRTLGSVFLILVGAWIALGWGTTLWNDWNLFGKKLSFYNSVSTVATCSNDMLGIGNCIVTDAEARADTAQLNNGINYLIFGLKADTKFNLMYSQQTNAYTTDVGMKYLINRSLILLALSGLPLLLGFIGLLQEAFGG